MPKIILRVVGFIGGTLFLSLFLFTFSDPHSIERAGKSFIKWKLASEAEEAIDSIRIPTSSRLGAFLNKKTGTLIEELKQNLKDNLPAILAAQITRMKDLNCECREKWQQRIASSIKMQISKLETARAWIIDFSHVRYMEIVRKLTKDVRIFLGVNSFVFLVFLLVSFLKPNAILHLFLPGALLFVSTLFCSYFYVLEQNWFLTILYDHYTGYSYLGYLAIVFGVLCDIVFNRGKVTSKILDAFFNTIGSAVSAGPC
jgi:hypothetical protein